MLHFTPLSEDQQSQYEELYNQCEEKSSDMIFSNLWAWNDKYNFEWAFADELCWIRYKQGETYVYAPPIGNWHRCNWQEIFSKNLPPCFEMKRVPESLAMDLQFACPREMSMEEDRNNWEYIYSVSELASLNTYHLRNKRNQSNKFKQYYNYTYKKLATEHIKDVIKFQQLWLQQSEIKEYPLSEIMAENKAILKVLNNWDKLSNHMFGGVLWVDNKIVAYTIGEIVDDKNLIIHFEKALFSYKGAYAAINRICLENMGNYKFVNREQDLGYPGLRKVKLEYHPLRFVKKYNLSCQAH